MQEDLIEHELPPRPRRRWLSPVPMGLLCVLLTVCGFIGGVLVEKGQASSTSSGSTGSASGFASGLAALRSSASGAAAGGRGALTAGGAPALGGSGPGAGGTGATVGQVAYTSGRTLYVTDAEGNTVKVTTSAASTVTKTVKSDVKAIRPGESVIVTGSTNANGAVKADSIRVSEAGSAAALSALFGGGGFARRNRAGASGREAGGSGEGPVLFGR